MPDIRRAARSTSSPSFGIRVEEHLIDLYGVTPQRACRNGEEYAAALPLRGACPSIVNTTSRRGNGGFDGIEQPGLAQRRIALPRGDMFRDRCRGGSEDRQPTTRCGVAAGSPKPAAHRSPV